MAGLLDSDIVKFLVAPRAFYRDKRADAANAEFEGLLGSLEQQGPVQPGGGVLGARAPDEQFWLKAAAIPGYEGLAGQQLGISTQGAQALGRQMQNQDWQANNMTMAQQAAQQLDALKAQHSMGIAEQNLARQWAGTQASMASSYASAANSGAGQQLTLAKLLEQNRKNASQNPDNSLYAQLPPLERQKANVALLNADTWATAASDVANWAEKRGSGAAMPLVGTAEADAFNTEWQSSVKPAFMQILNTGVLQGKEAEEIQDIIGQPADKVLTKSQLNVIKTAAQKVRDQRGNTYQSYGLQAPPIQAGGSAAARVLSPAKPVGKVTPVAPSSDGSIWYPVQR